MKRLMCAILSLVVFLSVIFCFDLSAFAKTTRIGDSDTFYSYSESDGVLTISGVGEIPDFTKEYELLPWYNYNSTIKKIVIEEGITRVGTYSFYYSAEQALELPSSLTVIGAYAFACNYNLDNVVVPYGVKTISNNAFYGSTSLINITLPDSLASIGLKAFQGCGNLSSVVIPYSVKTIGMNAFNLCTNLKSVKFQSMTQTVDIGSNAFTGCTALKSIAMPLNATCGVKSYGYKSSTTKYTDVTISVYKDSAADNYATSNGIKVEYLSDIPIELGVRNYNTYSFDNINTEYHYTYFAENSEEICFFTMGDVDLKARLYHNDTLIKAVDDISSENRNICVKFNAQKGETYDLYISSVNSYEEYCLIALPTDIKDFCIIGDYSIRASDGVDNDDELVFSLNNEMLMNTVFVVNFVNGLTHRFTYSNSFYNGSNIAIASEIALSCGANDVEVEFGNAASTFCINVEHSYGERIVQPTPDEDGYKLFFCINCDNFYKSDYFSTDKQIYTLSGKCVLSEDMYGNHTIDLPNNGAKIVVDGREYSIENDGSWTIRTFGDCRVVFSNFYGDNVTLSYKVDENNPDAVAEPVALVGYDMNKDGYINARDYVIFNKEIKNNVCDGYWQFANDFLTTYKRTQ